MRIQIKAMGMLKERTPPGGVLELEGSPTIADMLDQLEIDAEAIQAVTINGAIERDQSRRLVDGDDIVILPPVGGG